MRRTRLAASVTAVALLAGAGLTAGSPSAFAAGSVKGKSIVYIPGLTGVPFYTTVSCGAAAEAKALGMKYSYQGSPTFAVSNQTTVVNAVLATKPAAIMISLTDPQAMIAPLVAAQKQGVKIVAIDGDLNDKSVLVTDIESNGVKGGYLAGMQLAKLIGGKGSVLAIDNAAGSPVSEERSNGFAQAIKKYPKIKYLGIKYSNNETAQAASIASTTSTTNSSLAGIFSLETNNTEGAITGLRESGKTGKVKLVGYDSSAPIVAALKDGALQGDVVQYPLLEGKLGVEAAAAAITGKKVARYQTPPFVFATPKNVNSAKVQQYLYKSSC
jgi:ribose transport system substrate-binding protein